MGSTYNEFMATNTKRCVEQADKHLAKHPVLAVPVHVQCEGFRCLAYRDKDGTWINYHSGEPIQGPVGVIEYKES